MGISKEEITMDFCSKQFARGEGIFLNFIVFYCTVYAVYTVQIKIATLFFFLSPCSRFRVDFSHTVTHVQSFL
jgi:hypothetical protein